MVTRREMLAGIALGSVAASIVGPSALAGPAPKTAGGVGGEHDAIIREAQAALRGEIADGSAPAGARKIIACPICTYRITVTADASW